MSRIDRFKCKKTLLWAALFAAALWLFAACSEKKTDFPVQTPALDPDGVVTITLSPTEIAIVTPSPEPPRLDLSPYRLSTEQGQDVLYDILPLLRQEGKELLNVGFSDEDELTILYGQKGGFALSIERFSLRYGLWETLGRQDFSEPIATDGSISMYAFDPPLFFVPQQHTLYRFDPSSRTLKSTEMGDRIFGDFLWDGEDVLFFDESDGSLNRLLSNGEQMRIFRPDFRYQYVSLLSVTSDRKYASFSATDSYTQENVSFLVDLTSGEVMGQEEGSSYLLDFSDGVAALNCTFDWKETETRAFLTFRRTDAFTSSAVRRLQRERTDFFPSVRSYRQGFLLENRDAAYTLLLTDPGGEAIREITVVPELLSPFDAQDGETEAALIDPSEDEDEGDEFEGDTDSFWDGFADVNAVSDAYVLTSIQNENGICGVLLWAYRQTDEERETGILFSERLFAASPHTFSDYGVYAERVRNIYDTYGIVVLLEKDAALHVSTHEAEPFAIEDGNALLDEAFLQLESTLIDYPPQFFQTLCDRYLNGIVIEFTGTIRASDASSLDYPSALTCLLDRYRLIVFDVGFTADMRYTIFHEVSHMIDTKMDTIADFDDPLWSEAGWNALNPPGFLYYNAYNNDRGEPYDVVGSKEYTALDRSYQKRGKTENVYFVDIYSKTYATEDRAVLFGTLMRDRENDALLRCPHLLDKLKYYFAAIRRFYDPDGAWAQSPPGWERRLNELNEADEQKNAA